MMGSRILLEHLSYRPSNSVQCSTLLYDGMVWNDAVKRPRDATTREGHIS